MQDSEPTSQQAWTDPNPFSLRYLCGLISRQRFSISLVFVLAGSLLTLGIFLRPPEYQSTALLVIDRTARNPKELKGGYPESEVDTQVEMMNAISIVKLLAIRLNEEFEKKSSARQGEVEIAENRDKSTHSDDPSPLARETGLAALKRVVDHFVTPEPTPSSAGPSFDYTSTDLVQLQRKFRIRRRSLTDVISIEARAESPEIAARLANLYGDVYMQEQQRSRAAALQGIEETLARRIQKLKAELSEARQDIKLRSTLTEEIDQLAEIRQQRARLIPELRVAAPALPISILAFPSPRFLLMFGWSMAFGLAIAVAVYRDARRRRVDV